MMNQTRTFLIFALLFVAYLLFNQWMNDYHKPVPAPATVAAASRDVATGSSAGVPVAIPASASSAGAMAGASASQAGTRQVPQTDVAAPGQLVTLRNDVLQVTIDTRGGSVVRADLLNYPEHLKSSDSVRLLNDRPSHYFVAQDGLISAAGHDAAPDHNALFQTSATAAALAAGQQSVSVDLTWTNAAGVKVVKRYTLERGKYTVALSQQISNGSGSAWSGFAYRQLQRVVPPEPTYSNWITKYSDQSRYSYFGAAWYSPEDKFNKYAFDDFLKEPLKHKVAGGWEAMLQHYFVTAWIPSAKQTNTYTSAVVTVHGTPRYLIRSQSPVFTVAAGTSVTEQAQLYIGPKLPKILEGVAPGFELSINYGFMTLLASFLHPVLAFLHAVSGNWGVAIILLVLLINALIYKLNAAQYRSAARMRKLKPRMDALKERYGDDKQKMQQATMELYKKEKINPVAGCLPVLVTIPIFFALYELLRESVELRQAPFFGWIHDLSVADPYFVLPILNAVVMFISQHMMPVTPGMDPTQQKIMKFMPVLSAVFFAWMPAGLTLYYVVNGMCRLATQWWVYRQIDAAEASKGKA